MEFYKLFKRRTNFYELLEWIDRGFRPDKWKKIDNDYHLALYKLFKPLELISQICER